MRRRKRLPFTKFVGLAKNYLLGKIGLNKRWLLELKTYYGWKSDQQFYRAYAKRLKIVSTLWYQKPRKTEKQIRSFYQETDYAVLRQMLHHKNNCFPEIARYIPKNRKGIWFCEYGCGVAPVTSWLLPHFPNINFSLVDIDTPTLKFAKWRFRENPNVEIIKVPLNNLPLKRKYDLITCFEVLEHVTEPFKIIRHIVKHLKIGGMLFVDFIADEAGDENLAQSQAQRDETIDFLNSNLKIVWPLDKNWKKDGGFGQYVKLKDIKVN